MPTSATCKIALFALLATPLALAGQAPKAGNSPADAVTQFMRAISDSNLTRVAQLFGNSDGPAFRTHNPKDYEKRIMAMQLFLRHVEVKTLGDMPADKGKGRTVTAQLSHGACRVTISIGVMHAHEGWLVNNFDLDRASQINRPCEANSGGTGGGNLN
ncbi:MAG TPA: hypothetical protein VGM77_12650 [Gemmatimonadales bacterium]|jgi:hypothetical protein